MERMQKYLFWKNLPFGARSFLRRIVLFLALYTVMALSQSTVNQLLYDFSPIYSNKLLGYLIFPIIFIFLVLRWDKIKQIKYYTFSNKLFGWCMFASLACLLAPIKIFGKSLMANQDLFITVYFFLFLFAFLFLFLAILNYTVINLFHKEITFIVGIYIFYTLVQLAEHNFWPYMSHFIIRTLQSIVPIFFKGMQFSVQNYNVIYKKFSVNVGPSCAGFHSLATFSVLFFLALFLLKNGEKKIRYFKTFMAFLAGLVAIFLLNIFRVAVIVIIGGDVSPQLALNLFHEYLSAIFLILIFLFYLYFVIPRLIEKAN